MRVPKTLIVAAGTAGIISGALWPSNYTCRTSPDRLSNRSSKNARTGKPVTSPTLTKPTRTGCETKPTTT